MDRITLTPRGWCVLGVSVTAIGAGLLSVEGAVVAGGVTGLATLMVVRWLAARNLRSIVFERRLPGSTFAGDLLVARYLIRSGGSGGSGATMVEAEDLLTPKVRPILCDHAGPDGAEARAEIRIDSRGVVASADVVLRSEFPLGMFGVVRSVNVPSRMVVYPRPLMTRAMVQAEEALDAHTMAYSRFPEGADQFRGVREFRPGDPVTRIHWPATARVGSPMVREFDPPTPQPSHFTVLFHNYSPPGHLLRPRNFEVALSMVAGFLLYARGLPAPITFSGRLNGWLPVQVTSPQSLREALEVLACARYRPEKSMDALNGAIRALPQNAEARTFVISDTPVKLWSNLLPASVRPVVCLDTRGNFRKVFRMVEAGR